MADYQVLFDIVLAIAGAFGMWIMKTMSHNINRIDEDVRALPKTYIQKEDFRDAVNGLKEEFHGGLSRVERSIDAIFKKLDGKEDKSASIAQRRDQ